MKLAGQTSTVQAGDLQSLSGFGIKPSAKLYMMLSSGIYSDKIGAIVRELSCNARDAHRLANNIDSPFDIHIPNHSEKWFGIRDYGFGLDEAGIVQLTTYGESTKADSNDDIGAFGLGAKSPFCYTNSFTIISIHAGFKSIYLAFLDSDGVPQLKVITKVQSNDPTGLEIQVPVTDKDFTSFENKIHEKLQYFSPLPNITNSSTIWTFRKPILSGKDWRYYGAKNYDTKLKAIQGCVAYNLAVDNLKGALKTKLESLDLEVDFEIGDLEVAVSREALSYTSSTIQNLNQKFEIVCADIHKQILNHLFSLEGTKWQQHLEALAFKANNPNLFKFLSEQEIAEHCPSYVDLDKSKFSNLFIECKKADTRQFEFNCKLIRIREKALFFIRDQHKPYTHIRAYCDENRLAWVYHDVYIIHEKNATAILEYLGNPPFILMSSVPKPANLKTAPKQIKYAIDCANINQLTQRTTPLKGGFYANYSHGKVRLRDNIFKEYTSVLRKAKELGWLKDSDTIFLLSNAEHKKLASDQSKWINIFDHIKNEVVKWYNDNKEIVIQKRISERVSMNNYHRDFYQALEAHSDYNHIKSSSIAQIWENYKSIDKDIELNQNVVYIKSILSAEIPYLKDLSITSKSYSDFRSEALKEYPMLSYVLDKDYPTDDKLTIDKVVQYIKMVDRNKEHEQK